jgi:GGDEF domain-containing protein
MTIDGLSPESEDYDVVSQSLREFFSFRDLAFERGDDGFSVILPNLDAAHALRMAEEFHKKLTIQIRGREEGGARMALPLYMGLSSRAARLVEARRLIDEAGLALDRAREEDDSRIIAFKPDPDKYRLWLASMGHY